MASMRKPRVRVKVNAAIHLDCTKVLYGIAAIILAFGQLANDWAF